MRYTWLSRLRTRIVTLVSGPSAIPFSASNVMCGEYLQNPGVPGGHAAEDSPLPYSPSNETQPPRASLRTAPVVAPQRCSWSAGVQSVGEPKHGASNCVSQPLL